MTPAMAAILMPQLRAMLVELEEREGVPERVLLAARSFVAALEAWIEEMTHA